MSGQMRIATRKSPLALWQAEHVANRLRAARPGMAVSLVPLATEGDRIHGSLAAAGGKGLFVKALEQALESGAADIAVHSMKDVPAGLPPGFVIAAALERADPRDALVSDAHARVQSLPQGARIGTSSPRRSSQLLHRRPDLRIVPLRGNVETRIRKLDGGGCDAIVLAVAGLERLGLESRIRERIAPEWMLPAPGQGIIGVECLSSRQDLHALLTAIEHGPTRAALEAERAFAARLGGDCHSSIAAQAIPEGDALVLRGLVASPDGVRVLADTRAGSAADASTLGVLLAERLLAAGAGELLSCVR